ncbi:Fc.00g006170.m01.CDS01 [Cosmosporella sp. VM-42]
MASPVSPAKLVLLAAHFATHADIDNLTSLVAQYASIFRKELVLRIILTYLPETVKPDVYVAFLQDLAAGQLEPVPDKQLNTAFVDGLSDGQAIKKVRKLHLQQLSSPDALIDDQAEALVSFLLLRGYRMDEEAGMLVNLPDLLTPFLQDAPFIQTWLISTVLPLLRRNHEYYPQKPAQYSLREFQRLPDRTAIEYLLAETGIREDDYGLLGRDFRGLVGPWLYNDERWRQDVTEGSANMPNGTAALSCPGWEQVLEWLVMQASKSWKVALKTIEQWDGPEDIELGDEVNMWLQEPQQRYLDQTYARAALASAYLIPEATVQALEGAYQICNKIGSLMDQDFNSSLYSAASDLSPVPQFDTHAFPGAKAASFMRNDLLDASNPLTAPNPTSTDLLMALVLSSFILTRAGVPCTVRRAGDLAFIQDSREQKSELARLIRAISSHAPKNEDDYWIRSRLEILWLHSWGNKVESTSSAQGIFSTVSAEYIETELLKALLSNARYGLARSIYEESSERPLSTTAVQNTVQNSALVAFDNASNPNRTRGGLKKCDDIIHAFPRTMDKSLPTTKRIEALLRATHALSEYRLVLKQGEPFSPVVLRVHSDPISIIEKVVEQNHKAYTRLQEFLETGTNMVKAGLMVHNEINKRVSTLTDQFHDMSMIKKRIVAMCIQAALKEDDFETAYPYVVSRLGEPSSSDPSSGDEWSWKAALNAGKYVRTARSQKPTHLGTASGNPKIRHLEQRIECLATALRIAPPSQLQEVLKTFRRCEEQLDSAIREEAAKEDAWDAVGDLRELPGAFDSHDPERVYPPRNPTASAAARQAEEAPMSLFDLSRATARVATRNFNALSSLRGMAQGVTQGMSQSMTESQSSDPDSQDQQRLRKRDQLREAATGTLVSGVGWLIGANVSRGGHEEQH